MGYLIHNVEVKKVSIADDQVRAESASRAAYPKYADG
jgi:hypothetical protein